MATTIKEQARKGIYWSAIERFSLQGIQFVAAVILARLLGPKQFGLVGMVAIFLAISEMLVHSGFGTALLQRKDATNLDECSVFYFNILLGTSLTIVLILLAPIIASFFNNEELTLITRVLALNIVISSITIVQANLLSKRMNFRSIAKVNVLAVSVSSCFGVFFAFLGFGVWSLVWQSNIYATINTLALWTIGKWRPKLQFSFHSLKSMFSYASRLLLIGLLETSFYYIYYLIIGKYFSAESLGYYTRAKNAQSLPVNGTTDIVSKVAFPAFIQVQNDPVKLKQGGQKAITSLVFILYPVLIGILVTAKQFIVVVFGNKWLPSVPYLQIMCLIGLFYPLQTINLNILSAIGRSDLFFRIEVIKKTFICISIIIAIRFGIIALLTGELIVSFISFFINSHYSGVLINYKASNQLKEIAPYFVSAIAMGIVVFGITQLIGNFNTYLLFLTQIMTGTAVYIAISILFKFSPLGEIRLLILQYFHKLHTAR